MFGLIIYFIILYVLYFFWNKNSKTADNEGKKLDNKVLGWIIIAYICIGFYYVGSGSNYDECSPINMRGFQECISYPE
tara:strand:+ start:121 stop:354 length:234 start_codon:yes stop_codon:yes gene_type:complete